MLKPTDGYDILINGIDRTFRDRQDTAIEAARFLKARHREDVIEIRDRSTGERQIMLSDGRLG
jgi:hypothetical protein